MNDFLSHDKPIPQKEYTTIPFGKPPWDKKRNIAHEEACRDIDKSPDQLLVDVHDESLDTSRDIGQSIARTMARSASMQLRVEKETSKLNRIVLFFGAIGVILAIVSATASCIQAYYAKKSYMEQISHNTTTPPASVPK
jgi:hypothetical protein